MLTSAPPKVKVNFGGQISGPLNPGRSSYERGVAYTFSDRLGLGPSGMVAPKAVASPFLLQITNLQKLIYGKAIPHRMDG